jgi:6-phospho-beta-glucosidase
VELPCEVSSRGLTVLPVGHAPEVVRPLLLQMKEYERLTVQASVEHSLEKARAALEMNPLVGQAAARKILADYIKAFGEQMKLQAA